MKLIFGSVFGLVAAGTAFAQPPSEPASRCVQNCGDSTGTAPAKTPAAAAKSRARADESAKEFSLEEGIEYFNRRDWDNAIRSFEEALDKSPDDDEILGWLGKARGEKARSLVSADTSVVDARVELEGAALTRQIPELARSPEFNRIAKGFAGVIKHDWPIALVWWKDALNRDPGNVPLKLGVDLAQWMVDYRKRGGQQSTLKGARTSDDPDLSRLEKILEDHMMEELTRFADEWLQNHK